MGCWLETDGISGASINYGEECYGLICKQMFGKFIPMFLPFEGEYNDYGTLENIKQEPDLFKNMVNWFNQAVKDGVVCFPKKESSRNDHMDAVKGKAFYNIEDIMERAERGCLSYKGRYEHEGKGSIELVLFAKDIFEEAVRQSRSRKTWRRETYGEVLDRQKKDVLDTISKLVNKKPIPELNEDSTQDEILAVAEALKEDHNVFIHEVKMREKIRELFRLGCDDMWENNFEEVLSSELDLSKKEKLIDKIIKFKALIFFMGGMRINLGRTVNKGSQDDNEDIQYTFYKFLADRAEEKIFQRHCESCQYEAEGALAIGEKK